MKCWRLHSARLHFKGLHWETSLHLSERAFGSCPTESLNQNPWDFWGIWDTLSAEPLTHCYRVWNEMQTAQQVQSSLQHEQVQLPWDHLFAASTGARSEPVSHSWSVWAGEVPAMWSRGSKGSGTTTLLFIECDAGTRQKAASTAKVAHVCSWVGVKSISALEGQDFVTHLVIHTAIPVLQTLKCLRSLNWLKDYWFYF